MIKKILLGVLLVGAMLNVSYADEDEAKEVDAKQAKQEANKDTPAAGVVTTPEKPSKTDGTGKEESKPKAEVAGHKEAGVKEKSAEDELHRDANHSSDSSAGKEKANS